MGEGAQTRAGRATREGILDAAMRGFASRGFAATSIREIAAAAGTNVASIAYHFGGKEGLRTACAALVVERMRAATAAAATPASTPAEAEAALCALVEAMSRFVLLRPEARETAGFVLREMSQPSEALDLIYDGVFREVHGRVCRLWGLAAGRDPESEATRLAVFALIGQIVYFHLGRPVVTRRMGWDDVGPAEAKAVARTVTDGLRARLRAEREAADA